VIFRDDLALLRHHFTGDASPYPAVSAIHY